MRAYGKLLWYPWVRYHGLQTVGFGGLATGLSYRRPGISHAVIRVGFLMNDEIPLLYVA
jgi:hypothetical protein